MVARSEITLGFVGAGKIEKKNAHALLRDWVDANGGSVKAILPLTRDFWNPNLQIVADYLIAADVPIEGIVDDTTAKMREIKPVLSLCRKQHQSTTPAHKLSVLLGEARDARLIVLWDDEDDNVHDTVRAVDQAGGVVLLDLTDGLDRIDLQTETVPEEEEFEEPESDELPDAEDEDEAEAEDEADEAAGEDEENIEAEAEDGPESDNDDESESENDLEPEAEADGEESYDELPEDEEFELPEEAEGDVLTELMETEAGLMTVFQGRLIELLERLVALAEAGLAEAPPKAAPAPTRKAVAAKEAAKKAVAPPVKRTVKPPAPTTKKAPAPTKPVKRTVKAPAKAATAPARRARAEDNGSKPMSKAAAQRILDEYRPRRGRPPAEVTQARAVLGI